MHSVVKTWAGKGARTTFALALAAGMGAAWAHGDVTPQPVDTSTLPQVGAKWLEDNPYSKGPARAEAVRIGASGYNQNCARCHGLKPFPAALLRICATWTRNAPAWRMRRRKMPA